MREQQPRGSCYLPSWGSVGPWLAVARGHGLEGVTAGRGEERGGRAALEHLGSQTRPLERRGGQGSRLERGWRQGESWGAGERERCHLCCWRVTWPAVTSNPGQQCH